MIDLSAPRGIRRTGEYSLEGLRMGCDMAAALGRATADEHTLFGYNSTRRSLLCIVPGKEFTLGEKVRATHIELPQARRTCTVLGSRPIDCWGYTHGVNEHGVAAGCTTFPNKLESTKAGLMGFDLVRLLLERARSARQAVDHFDDLVKAHGKGAFPGCRKDEARDHAFLIADASEAILLETAAGHWVEQEIRTVRAAGNVCTIRQDWNRISPGLGSLAIDQGWWPNDGSKLDFAEALSRSSTGDGSALRRWGRATYLLEQQNGRIDLGFLRRVLGDHYEGTNFETDPQEPESGPVPLCQHATGRGRSPTVASLAVEIASTTERLPWSGCAFGPPCMSVYFPIFLEGELPGPLAAATPGSSSDIGGRILQLEARTRTEPALCVEVRDRLAQLQADFDQETEEFALEGASLKQTGDHSSLQRLTSTFMQHNFEKFDDVLSSVELLSGIHGLGNSNSITRARKHESTK